MRLAVLYALLDLSAVIRLEHLRAALAMWKYCERSARYVGSALGDPLADELLERLHSAGEDGLTRTQIRDALGRNRSGSRIDQALHELARHRLAHIEQESTDGRPGRPVERWRAT